MHESCKTDVSVLIAVVWYAYRGWGAFKFSALVRTILSQAAIYLIFMILLEIFNFIALNLLGVWPLARVS